MRPGSGFPPAEALPTSTTHEILAGKRLPRLPRLEFVEAFVAACLQAGHCPPDEVRAEVEHWRRTWRRLADADPRAPAKPEPPAGARGRWARRRLSLLAIAVALLSGGVVAGAAAARYLTDAPSPTSPIAEAEPPCPQQPASATPPGRELVLNGAFDTTKAAWWDGSGMLRAHVENSSLRINVQGGTAQRWDAIVEQRDIPLMAGRHYTLSFELGSATPVTIRATVQMQYHPYQSVITKDITAGPTSCRYTFTALGDVSTDKGVVSFQLGGHPTEHSFTLDNVSLVEHGTV